MTDEAPAGPEGVTSGPRYPRAWRIAFIVLCTVGVCLSADLLRLHVNVHTDPDYHSYCAMSTRVNCETVAESEYSVFLGLPVSIWGLLAYLGMGLLAAWGMCRRLRVPSWPFGLLFWISLLAAGTGILLFAISHFLIESVCIVCMATYLVSLALLTSAWLALRRAGVGPVRALAGELRAVAARPGPVLGLAGGLGVALVALWLAVPPYWELEASTGPGGLLVGSTPEGHPWIGARQPDVEVVEFSDYQCPHCGRGHADIRRLIEAYPDRLRLVHRHYPLDHHCNPIVRRPYHPQACRYARMAFCAGRQGRFWEANDYLFAQGRRREPVTSAQLAEAVKIDAAALESCLPGEEARRALEADMAAGRARKVRGTPTFFLGDRAFPGRVPRDVVDEALGRGSR